MSDGKPSKYPSRVKMVLPCEDLDSYRKAAAFINDRAYDVISVQHEFGIYGGPAGSHLLTLLREAKMPIVTTFHTVLREPDEHQRRVMDELIQLSERVVVMGEVAVRFLEEIYEVPRARIDLIPHGIPVFSAEAGTEVRESLDVDGPLILTFGLLSPDKGVQYMIEAMPEIVARHPGATYVVLGATHPNIKASDAGETYRHSLKALAKLHGVDKNVRFIDRFVSLDELISYLAASDIYVTPYLNPRQITSGTLAYAVGAGKAVVSTPYWYAEEVLADGRGLLVPFRDSKALAEAVLRIQNHPEERDDMRRRAAAYGHNMRWPEVGNRYLESFARARSESSGRLRTLVCKRVARDFPKTLPTLRLDHVVEMTDDVGIFQHATHNIPNRAEGYCLDDNARALILAVRLAGDPSMPQDLTGFQKRYLAFVLHAFDMQSGRFHNFMSYGRDWLDGAGSDDSTGRGVWALGSVVGRGETGGMRSVALDLFERSAPALYAMRSPRAWAYGMLGADEVLRSIPSHVMARQMLERLGQRLLELYRESRSQDWPWFECVLSYANARLSQAVLLAGHAASNAEAVDAGLDSLSWLMRQQAVQDTFAPIGTRPYVRGAKRELFDQQPLEAWATVSACVTAAEITGDSHWIEQARCAFAWFLGDNLVGLPLYDPVSGGCRDGLHADRVNENQGAESTLSYLCARVEIEKAERAVTFQSQADIL